MTCFAPAFGDGFRHSDLERAAEALSIRLQPQNTALTLMNSPLMRGRLLLHEVQPGLHATGYDMRYEVDLPLMEEAEDILLCGSLVGGACEPMMIDTQHISFAPGQTRLICVPGRRMCRGLCRAGTQGAVAGFSMQRSWIDRVAGEDDSLDPLRRLFDGDVALGYLTSCPYLQQSAQQMLSAEYSGALGRVFIEGATLASVVEVVRVLSQQTALPPGITPRQLRRVKDARDLLAARLADPPGMDELCRTFVVNATTLRAQFKAVFGTTIFGWLRDRRLEVAKVMLSEGELSVTEVGWRVGFANAGAFSTAYRRRFGVAPREERRKSRC